MRTLLCLVVAVLLPLSAFGESPSSPDELDGIAQVESAELGEEAAPAPKKGIDDALNAAIGPVASAVSSVVFVSITVSEGDPADPSDDVKLPLIVVWLIFGGLFFTFYLRFLPFRYFRLAIDLVRGRYDNPNDPGEVSHFQALATALSGTVGLGNIAGVAVAISLGGPGATFWMILAGILGMSSKLAECTLAVKYRETAPDGTVSGGPMYYLAKGLTQRGYGPLGKTLGTFYGLAIIMACLGGGNLFQANQAYAMFVSVSGGDASFFADKGWLFGLILAAAVGVVIIGGIKGIARVTDKLVPGMAVLYLVSGTIILAMNIGEIPGAIGAIIGGAFSPEAVSGGIIGAIIQGFRRAAFSNEAGLGSAAIAHSAVKTDRPATEGLVAMLEPFIDTIVICTMTSLIITTTVYEPGLASQGIAGVTLTSQAFESAFSFGPIILAIAVNLFAFSTAITWSYYGLKGFTYVFGSGAGKELAFKGFFCLVIVLGCTMDLGAVVDLSDAMLFILAIPNLAGMYLMAREVRDEVDEYVTDIESGAIPAQF